MLAEFARVYTPGLTHGVLAGAREAFSVQKCVWVNHIAFCNVR